MENKEIYQSRELGFGGVDKFLINGNNITPMIILNLGNLTTPKRRIEN
jgi:hypothetical protein